MTLLLLIDWKKIIRKFTFLNYSFFWKRAVTLNLKNFSWSTIFRWCTFGKFFIVEFNYLSGRLRKGKRSFGKILIDHYAGDIKIKISLICIKKKYKKLLNLDCQVRVR